MSNLASSEAALNSAAPRTGFTAAYDARVYAIALDGGARRTIVDRAGMNTGPRYSPDGRSIAFISTNGRNDIMASRSLTVVPAAGVREGVSPGT